MLWRSTYISPTTLHQTLPLHASKIISISYCKKAAHKIMVILTLGVDFTSMLLATFMYAETKGAKDTIYFTFLPF
jgi:hypothetical protein